MELCLNTFYNFWWFLLYFIKIFIIFQQKFSYISRFIIIILYILHKYVIAYVFCIRNTRVDSLFLNGFIFIFYYILNFGFPNFFNITKNDSLYLLLNWWETVKFCLKKICKCFSNKIMYQKCICVSNILTNDIDDINQDMRY